MLEPVPSHSIPAVLGMTASEAPRAMACSTIRAFSAYDVVLSPERAPRSFLGHGTVTMALTEGGRSHGSVMTTWVSPALPRGEPSGPGPDVTVTRMRPNRRSWPSIVAATP